MKSYQIYTIQTYNDHAKEFDDTRSSFVLSERIDVFLELLPGKSILEVGCGPGRDARVFVDKGFQVLGTDLSERLLALARKKVSEATFEHMDATELHFENTVFDGVWASAVYLHLLPEDFLIALSESFRVLRQGGVIRFSVKKGDGLIEEEDKRLIHAKRLFYLYQRKQVEEMTEKAGFEILDILETDHKRYDKMIQWIDVIAKKPV